MELRGTSLKAVCSFGAAFAAYALGGFGFVAAVATVEILGKAGEMAIDLSAAQSDALSRIEQTIRKQVEKNYKTWLSNSSSAGRSPADIEAALEGLGDALIATRPTFAAIEAVRRINAKGEPIKNALSEMLLARLDPKSVYRTAAPAAGVFVAMVEGVAGLARTDRDLLPIFEAIRFDILRADNERAEINAKQRHDEQIGEIQASAEVLARIEGLMQQFAAAREAPPPATPKSRATGVSRKKPRPQIRVDNLRKLFIAVNHELPKASDANLIAHVEAAIDALVARAEAHPDPFNDSQEIVRAITAAREKLSQADTDGALRMLEDAYSKEYADIEEIEELAAARKRGAARLKFEQAEILKISYRWDEAILAFRSAARLAPSDPWPLFYAGDLHRFRGEFRLALEAYRQGRDGTDDQISRVVGAQRYADILLEQNLLEEAGESLVESLSFADGIPNEPYSLYLVAMSYRKLGVIRRIQDRFDEATVALTKSLKISLALADEPEVDPIINWRSVGTDYFDLGDIAVGQGRRSDAEELYKQGRDILEEVARHDPLTDEWQRDSAVGRHRLGEFYQSGNEFALAAKEFEAELEVLRSLVARNPGNVQWQVDLAKGHIRLGQVSDDKGENFRTALGILTPISADGRLADGLAELIPMLRLFVGDNSAP